MVVNIWNVTQVKLNASVLLRHVYQRQLKCFQRIFVIVTCVIRQPKVILELRVSLVHLQALLQILCRSREIPIIILKLGFMEQEFFLFKCIHSVFDRLFEVVQGSLVVTDGVKAPSKPIRNASVRQKILINFHLLFFFHPGLFKVSYCSFILSNGGFTETSIVIPIRHRAIKFDCRIKVFNSLLMISHLLVD